MPLRARAKSVAAKAQELPKIKPPGLRSLRLSKSVWYTAPFFLLHMLVCSLAHIPSLTLMKIMTKTNYGHITKTIRRIASLVDLGFDMDKSCEVASRLTPVEYLKDFILRLSQTVKLGEDVSKFLAREYSAFMMVYVSLYERARVKLRRFSEAYSAIFSSTILLCAILAFTAMLWSTTFNTLMILIPSVAITYAIFIFAYYVASPVNRLVPEARYGRIAKLLRIERIANIALLPAMSVTALMGALQVIPTTTVSLILASIGALLLLIGSFGMRYTERIKRMDERFPDFISMLSTSISVAGASLLTVLREISRIDFGPLNTLMSRMRARLEANVDPKICWKLLQEEANSRLINTHVDMFVDAVDMGAHAGNVGDLLSKSSLTILDLRRRSREAAAFIKGIALPLQPALCAVFGLIIAILFGFMNITETYKQAGAVIGLLTYPPLNLITASFTMLMLVTGVSNAYIIYLVSGCEEFTFTYYLGIMVFIGWLAYFLLFIVVSTYLSSVGLGRLMEGLPSV